MMMLEFDEHAVARFASAGNLINCDGFIHGDRCLDTFVLIVGLEGDLFIAQNEQKMIVGPEQYLLLFPGYRHFGYMRSTSVLKYYWCHFYLPEGQYRILPQACEGENEEICRLPEFGPCVQPERLHLLFRYLIDSSRRANTSAAMLDFTTSLLLLELIDMAKYRESIKTSDRRATSLVFSITEYVRYHCAEHINVSSIAKHFGYNANYLSTIYKRLTGTPLLYAINKARIDAAKSLLLNSSNSIKYISAQVGFVDEKHFMKVFRSIENATPSQFRNAYIRKHVNNK